MQIPRMLANPRPGHRLLTRTANAPWWPPAGAFAWALLALLSVCPTTAQSQELTPEEAEAIAHDAFIYGFPIVESYRRMHDSVIERENGNGPAAFNTLQREAAPMTAAAMQVETPNVDTVSLFLWMDLRTEPVVLSVPAVEDDRYHAIQLVDLYNFNFAYIGSRTTGDGEGDFLIAGPRWEGERPEGIAEEIRSETEFAFALYRTQLKGPEDLERVQALQAQYGVKPLSEFLAQPPPESAASIEFPDPEPFDEPDLSFFSTLNFLLPFCPPHPSERELRERFARIGVAAGSEFEAAERPAAVRESLQRGIEAAMAAIDAAAGALRVREVTGGRDYLANDYLKRAAGAKFGRYNNSKEEALYQLYLTDADGEPLDASENDYVMRISEAELPPVKAFWSITIYDHQNKSLVPNAADRHQISSRMLPDLEKDGEGGVAILIQHEPPVEAESKNWLPAPDGPFYMMLRLYWPEPDAYDGTWTPPLIWPAESPPQAPVPTPEGTEAAEEVKPVVTAEEPKPELVRPTVWEEPTEVQIVMYVIDVDEVNSASQNFSASVYFEARWKNPFLRHKGPDPIHRELVDVWNPRLTIISQQMAWRSYPESVEIQPDGTVVYRQKVWGRFSQPLDLRDFPFDRQQLSLHVVAAGLMEKDVELVPLKDKQGRKSDIATNFSLPDFRVASWNASPSPYFPGRGDIRVAGYEMKIDVARRPIYYVLKIIVPLCLIVAMSWLPRWLDPEQAGTNIGISTSAFLTLVAYLFAITVLLPRVSYVTRMDRFILLSMLMVFAGLIQTVINTVLVRNERKFLARRFDRGSRGLYPILLAVVLAVSFVFV